MPRSFRPLPAWYKKRDVKYDSPLVPKVINNILSCGQKTAAQGIVYDALDIVRQQVKDQNPVEVMTKAIENCRPALKTKSRRVGGATYQVPVEVPYAKGISYAIKWIITSARSRKGKPMAVKFANEILLAYKGEGDAIKKKMDTHKMAESNRAFAHLAF